MANEKFTQLPTVASSTVGDIIAAVQGGISVQQTLQQVLDLGLSQTILNYAGNPNTHVAGDTFQLCWDTANNVLYVCTVSGSAATATWTLAGSVTFPISAANGGTGVASPTAKTLPVAQGASAFTFLGPLTNGQLLIGSTGANPVPATITAGTGINVANGAGTITISTSGAGTGWTDVTGATQALAVNNGYIANRGAGNVAFTLPASSAIGDTIYIVGRQNGWSVAQGAGQQIFVSGSGSTIGVGGSISSTNAHDCITLVCTVANLEWASNSIVGIITVV